MNVRVIVIPSSTLAANLGRDRIVRLLHSHGARDFESAAGRAALQGKTETLHLIYDLAGRPSLDTLSLAGPAYTLSVEGTAARFALGARVIGPDGVDTSRGRESGHARPGKGLAADLERAGGMVLLDAFHRDAMKTSPIGGSVVFVTNELLQLFPGFRVVRYEDTEAVADFGRGTMRVVRLATTKP